MNYYDIEVTFNNGQKETYVEQAETSFEAIKNFLNSSKGAIKENIQAIEII